MNVLPENLKYYRKRGGYTQTELAAYINKRKSTVCNYENGYTEPSYAILQQISEFLGVSVSDLLQDHAAGVQEEGELRKNTVPLLSAETGEPTDECFSFPPSYFGDIVLSAFYMPDDSMKNINLCEGDLVLCSNNEVLHNGDLAAFFEPSVGIFLRYYYEEDDGVTLTAPGKALPLRKKKEEVNILGKVIKAAVSFC